MAKYLRIGEATTLPIVKPLASFTSLQSKMNIANTFKGLNYEAEVEKGACLAICNRYGKQIVTLSNPKALQQMEGHVEWGVGIIYPDEQIGFFLSDWWNGLKSVPVLGSVVTGISTAADTVASVVNAVNDGVASENSGIIPKVLKLLPKVSARLYIQRRPNKGLKGEELTFTEELLQDQQTQIPMDVLYCSPNVDENGMAVLDLCNNDGINLKGKTEYYAKLSLVKK